MEGKGAALTAGGQGWVLVAADFVKTGGMDRANYALADYLARQGVPVHLVGHRAGAALLAYPNLRWHEVARPLGRDALGWGRLDRAGRRWAAGGGHVLVNGGNCAWGDLNWVHYVHAAYRSAAVGGPVRQAWRTYKHRRALRDERRALGLARVIIANSERTRRELMTRLGLPGERIHTVYYGCDPEQFRPASAAQRAAARQCLGWRPERRTALFLGALGDRRKGFDTLFAAWRRLCARPEWRQGTGVDLMVAGRGGELAAWRRRAAEAGFGDSCQFLGFRRDVPTLLAASDLVVSPTRYEAYGLGVQEALACGLPAVVSADAGVAERMPASLAGLLLRDPESSSELEERLLAWRGFAAELRPELAALSAQLRAYTWDAMAARLVALAQGDAA